MDKLKSRKFWIAVLGALLGIAAPVINGDIPADKGLELAMGVLVSYLLGQGYADGQTAKAQSDADEA